MTSAVIATIGHDRPGLVSELTSLVTSLKLNIEDSRMTVLGGEFAVIMGVSGGNEQLTKLEAELRAWSGEDMATLFRYTDVTSTSANTLPYQATVTAMDHPGIVATIASFFSERNINIHDLRTEATPAAHTGTPIFNIELIAEVPSTENVANLKQAFENFCADADLDGEFSAIR